jgi:type II secretory pathway component PulJ
MTHEHAQLLEAVERLEDYARTAARMAADLRRHVNQGRNCDLERVQRDLEAVTTNLRLADGATLAVQSAAVRAAVFGGAANA